MRRTHLAGLAVVAAMATVLASAVPAIAAAPDTAELAPVVVDGTVAVTVPAASVPVVDSQIGRGVPLGTTAGTIVPLGGAAAGATSALVRVSALSATADTTVYRSGGVPVLLAPQGGSASTAVLLPVHDGAVSLWADAPVDVRVEVLAGFAGRADQPGAMVPVEEPVLRADTDAGLAASGVGATEVPVGVVGVGDIPSENVRAVFLTLDVTTAAAVSLQTNGQTLNLPIGRSVVTTIATPDDRGIVGIRSLGPAVQLRAWVSGWVPDAPFQASQQNLPGSFDVTSDPTDGGTVHVGEATGRVAVDATRRVDAAYTVALLSAASPSETTVLDVGRPYDGRGHGAVVDAARGALPQLTLFPASRTDENVATLRRGTAMVSWAPLGDILGEETFAATTADPAIAIVSPAEGARVDLGEGGYFTLAGTVDAPEGGIDRVEIAGPDGLIGTADVFVDDDRVRWEFGAAAPRDGTYAYTATVFDRAGAQASATRSVVVEAVDDEDTVVAPDVWVYNEDATELTIVDETTVELAVEPEFSPGDRVVAAVNPATPEGLYAEVRSFDRVGDRWRVTTAEAELTDVFYQVDIDEDREYSDLSATAIDDEVTGDPENTPGTEYGQGDAGYAQAFVATGTQVDLAPASCASEPLQPGSEDGIDDTATGPCANVDDEDPRARSAGLAARQVPAASSESGFDTTLAFNANLKWESKKDNEPLTFSDYRKSKADPEAALNDEFNEMVRARKAGATLSLKGQIGVKTGFKLETDITWKWGFIPTGIEFKSFRIALTSTLKASLGLKLNITAAQSLSAYNKIATFRLPTVTVMAGPVPIVLLNDVDTAMRTESKLEASASGELVITRVDTFGYEYTEAKGWQRIDQPPKTQFNPFTPKALESVQLKFTGQITSGPVVTAKVAMWGLAGPELELSAQAGIRAELVTKASPFEVYVTLGVFVTLALKAKVAASDAVKKFAAIFGAKKFEIELASLEWTWDIWKGREPIIAPPPKVWRPDGGAPAPTIAV